MLAMEWGEIDCRSRTIRMHENISRGALTTPKSESGRRIVNMDDQLWAILRLNRARIPAEFLKHSVPRPAFEFPSRLAHGSTRATPGKD
jgi:hypothetical protein